MVFEARIAVFSQELRTVEIDEARESGKQQRRRHGKRRGNHATDSLMFTAW